jgi:hypothetical protein
MSANIIDAEEDVDDPKVLIEADVMEGVIGVALSTQDDRAVQRVTHPGDPFRAGGTGIPEGKVSPSCRKRPSRMTGTASSTASIITACSRTGILMSRRILP